MSLRLALVERADDGEITLRVQSGDGCLFASMDALAQTIRKDPAKWAGRNPETGKPCEWTLVAERPSIQVTETSGYTIDVIEE